MKYIETYEEFLNESIGDIRTTEDNEPEVLEPKEKFSLNKTMYNTIEQIYKEACEFEQNDNPTNTFELFLKESFVTFAEMTTLVLKENPEISKIAGLAALRKYNEKSTDDTIITAKIHEYLNELMGNLQGSYSGKMEEMIQENPAIAMIAAKALSMQQSGNPDANNY